MTAKFRSDMNTLPALYTLADSYRQLAEKLADADLDATTIAETIDASGIVDDIATKAQGIEFIARSAEAHHDAIDAEISRLTKLKKSRSNLAAGLRAYLLLNMQNMGISKLECPLFTVKVRDNPPSVDVYEPGLIPAEYMRQPETPPAVPDKTAIAAAIKAGKDVPGAVLKRGQKLAIT